MTKLPCTYMVTIRQLPSNVAYTQCSTVVVCAVIHLYGSRMLGNADDVRIRVTM